MNHIRAIHIISNTRPEKNSDFVLTNGESSEIITKYETAPDTAKINGKVTNMQKGQQGPAMTIGVPSILSHNTNIFPRRLAQQHQKR